MVSIHQLLIIIIIRKENAYSVPASGLNSGQKETIERAKKLHLLERVRISGPQYHHLRSSKSLSKLQHPLTTPSLATRPRVCESWNH